MDLTDINGYGFCSLSTVKFIPFIFLGFSSLAPGQIDQIVRTIAKTGTLSFDEDVQFNRFALLNEKATDEELEILVNHASPAMRGYAFWGLAKRHYPELKMIFINHLTDIASVYQKNGCMRGDESVISSSYPI